VTTVRLIKHEPVPKCGSYEVHYSDGTPSKYFSGRSSLAAKRRWGGPIICARRARSINA
jgi:hypothetical protein